MNLFSSHIFEPNRPGKSFSNASTLLRSPPPHHLMNAFASTQSISLENNHPPTAAAAATTSSVTIMKMMPLSRNLSHSRLELVTDSSSLVPPAKPPLRIPLDLHATIGSHTNHLFRSRPLKPTQQLIAPLIERNMNGSAF